MSNSKSTTPVQATQPTIGTPGYWDYVMHEGLSKFWSTVFPGQNIEDAMALKNLIDETDPNVIDAAYVKFLKEMDESNANLPAYEGIRCNVRDSLQRMEYQPAAEEKKSVAYPLLDALLKRV